MAEVLLFVAFDDIEILLLTGSKSYQHWVAGNDWVFYLCPNNHDNVCEY